MIKLLNILTETENHPEQEYHEMHWRDHIKEILKHASKALKTSDPNIIGKYTSEIIKHAESAHEKHHTQYDSVGVDGTSGLANIHTNNANF
jgi:monomeric isocitrate dehydrogenase